MCTVFFHVIQVLGRTTPKHHLETVVFPDKASSKRVLSQFKKKQKVLLMIGDVQDNKEIHVHSHDASLSDEWLIYIFHDSILILGSKFRNNFSCPCL